MVSTASLPPAEPVPSAETRPSAGLTKEEYMRIRAELSFSPSLLPTLGIMAFGICLAGAAYVLLRHGGTWAFLLSQCLLAIFFFNNFSLLHECGHNTAARSSAINAVIGHYASLFCFLPFYPWKYIHQQHHVWTGNIDKDPVLKALKRFRDQGVPGLVRLSWWSWIPLTALVQHIVFLTYPYVMWRGGNMTRGQLLRTILSVVWLPVGYAGLWLLAPDIVKLSNMALGFVLFLVLEELVNLPHHIDRPSTNEKLPLWEQYRAARSCYYPRGISELIVLNFNLHIEHHLFPTLPWYRLRKARELIRSALGDRYTECIGISWNLKNRTRDLDAIVALHRGKENGKPLRRGAP